MRTQEWFGPNFQLGRFVMSVTAWHIQAPPTSSPTVYFLRNLTYNRSNKLECLSLTSISSFLQ